MPFSYSTQFPRVISVICGSFLRFSRLHGTELCDCMHLFLLLLIGLFLLLHCHKQHCSECCCAGPPTHRCQFLSCRQVGQSHRLIPCWCLPLQRYSKSSSKAAIPSRKWGFPLFHSLPNTYIICLFHFIRLVWNGVLLLSQLGMRLNSFIYVCSPLVLPFCAMMVSFACFSNGCFLLEL